MHSKPFAIFLSIFLVTLSLAGNLNSQQNARVNPNTQQGVLQRLQALEEQQALVIANQEKTLLMLEEIAKNARQAKIFASRG